uniref:Macrophage mannose receptor 1-like n=1 Tax=Branchiostoma floridae TaxID=7739 RepID=C3Z6S4_BRAFL|eukprot:XP_002595508.1 hypothetical protein BRAFLDRAFT_69086 [Branchiostoma floridae]
MASKSATLRFLRTLLLILAVVSAVSAETPEGGAFNKVLNDLKNVAHRVLENVGVEGPEKKSLETDVTNNDTDEPSSSKVLSLLDALQSFSKKGFFFKGRKHGHGHGHGHGSGEEHSGAAEGSSGGCASGYQSHDGTCYRAYGDRKSYDDAKAKCAADGGRLVAPKTERLDTFIMGLVQANGGGDHWIGLDDRASEGVWTFSDGIQMQNCDFKKWAPGEPNNNGGQDCVQYWAGRSNRWDDDTCSRQKKFICQIGAAEGGSGSCASGYQRYDGTCYRAYGDRKSYDDAKAKCAADGGRLVAPKTESLDTFIMGLVQANGGGDHWIGLDDRASEGVWTFSDGTQMQRCQTDGDASETIVTSRNGPQESPTITEGRTVCSTGREEGNRWDDDTCSRQKKFICQIGPGDNTGCTGTSGNSPGYMSLGCWKDKSSRAIGQLEGKDSRLSGDYKRRDDALGKCYQVAKDRGFMVFGVQNGGQCFGSPIAGGTYRKYGPSSGCRGGEGGGWANDVYRITDANPKYFTLGCWKDTSNRAIAIVEGSDSRLDGQYSRRKDAINKCYEVAKAKGNAVFSVQNGGQCGTSSNAQSTYYKFGRSTACKTDGKGGGWANQVYRIIGAAEGGSGSCASGYQRYDGTCYRAYGDRKSYDDAKAKCAADGGRLVAPKTESLDTFIMGLVQANGGGDHWIGLDDRASEGVWTFSDGTQMQNCDFKKWAPGEPNNNGGQDCVQYWAGAGNRWDDDTCSRQKKFICQIGPGDNTGCTGTSGNSPGYMSLGCWKDKSSRAIGQLEDSRLSGDYKSRPNALGKCYEVAKDRGFMVFGVQNGGQCFGTPIAGGTYRKYGPSTGCAGDGEGGGWANNVYRITDANPKYFTLGCWKDTSNRAIAIVEGSDSRLDGQYSRRKDAINKCYEVAKAKGNAVFSVQNGGQCGTSSNAQSTYYKFGRSTACKTDGKGGGWANQVYRIIGAGARFGWLQCSPSWAIDASGTPYVRNGVTYGPGQVLDGDSNTYWNPQGTSRNFNRWYIIFNFGKRYRLWGFRLSNYGDTTHDIKKFQLQWSAGNNPYDWKDALTVDEATAGTNNDQYFYGFGGTGQYWRLYITRTHSGYQPNLKEIGFYGMEAGAAEGSGSCASGYQRYDGTCYRAYGDRKSYDDAMAQCAADGGRLVAPKTEMLDTFIMGLVQANGGGDHWIGLDDKASEGVWTYSDGTQMQNCDFKKWAPGEPNNAGGQDCVQYWAAAGHRWDDDTCSRQKKFICQIGPGDNAGCTGPSGYSFIGCYVDNVFRVFPHALMRSDQLTAGTCAEHCRSRGYTYCGTEWHNECFCGNDASFAKLGPMKPVGECNAPCRGDSNEKCGGFWRISVYRLARRVAKLRWRADLRCGNSFPAPGATPGECDPDGTYHCCSSYNWCGNTPAHCTCNGCIDYRRNNGTSWQQLDGSLRYVSVGPAGVWGVNCNNDIWYREGTYGDERAVGSRWRLVSGKLKQLTVGYNVVWGVNARDEIWIRVGITSSNPTGTDWVLVPGSLSMIYVSPSTNKVWGCNAGRQIFRRRGIFSYGGRRGGRFSWFQTSGEWAGEASGTPASEGGVTFGPSNIFDGNPRSCWKPTGLPQNYNQWSIIMNFGVSYLLSQIRITNYGDTTHDIKSFKLQVSATGSPYNWQDALVVPSVTAGSIEPQEFDISPVTGQYWRLFITATHSGSAPWLVGVAFNGIQAGVCPSGWSSGGYLCYRAFADSVDAATAATNCGVAGGRLATVKHRTINNLLVRLKNAVDSNADFWIGLSDKETEGVWMWSDGTVSSGFNAWAPGEPNNAGNEDCVHYWSHSKGASQRDLWNDIGCSHSKKYLCERGMYTLKTVITESWLISSSK